MKNRILVIVAILLALVVATQAQTFSRVGTSMAQFLKIPAGARGAALGGAYAAASEDVYAMSWNPAGIGRVRKHLWEVRIIRISRISSIVLSASVFPSMDRHHLV